MKIYVDGKEVQGAEVRVVFQVGDAQEHTLHTLVTHEGVIFDAVAAEGNVSYSSGETVSEIFDRLETEAFEILNDLDSIRD